MLAPISHPQAVDWIDERTNPMPGEECAVAGAVGRVLAGELRSRRDHPAIPVAAVDGYALSSAATVGAGDYNPLPLRVRDAHQAQVKPEEACKVMSGEPLPGGTDTVMPVEETELRGGFIDIFSPVAAGANVIPPGREAREGDTVLAAGRILRPADTAMVIALGTPTVAVCRRPVVGVVSARNDIADASGAMVAALVERDGGIVDSTVAGVDGLASILAGADHDLLLVIGASGVGANDNAAVALSQCGDVAARGVAINPGETTTLGSVNDTPVVILPGPPLAALFAYDMIAGRAVRRLAGRSGELPYGIRRLELDRKVASGLGRLECCRVRVSAGHADPIAVADNRTLSTAVRADGFVLVPEQSEGFAPGGEVTVYMYDQRY